MTRLLIVIHRIFRMDFRISRIRIATQRRRDAEIFTEKNISL